MMRETIKNLFLYMGLKPGQYRLVRPEIAERSRMNLKWMSLVMSALALIMIVMDYAALKQGLRLLYALVAVVGVLIHLSCRKPRSPSVVIALSYLVLGFLFTYAILLTASPSNMEVPATSIIVYMVLFPMLVPDVAWRMILMVSSFEGIYLFVSHAVKSHRVFQADISNSLVLVPLGLLVFVLVSTGIARQIWESMRNKAFENHMIISLTDIIEGRDEYTGSHVKSTADYAERILRQMQRSGFDISDRYIERVVLAAPLHDVGKIKIPDAILNKPGRLTDEEFAVMKKHARYGGEMVEKILREVDEEELTPIARNIASYHHERVDGKGYPDGLAGDQIPLEARVMAVADVYDALISKRVYKEPIPKEEALAIMEAGRGTQFDAAVLDAFLEAER